MFARENGADRVIVSNHGGRQLDGARPALAALPSIVEVAGPSREWSTAAFGRGRTFGRRWHWVRLVPIGRPCSPCRVWRGGGQHAIKLLATEIDRDMALLLSPARTRFSARTVARAQWPVRVTPAPRQTRGARMDPIPRGEWRACSPPTAWRPTMAMTMTGEVHLPASKDIVWAKLNDPEMLKACIPEAAKNSSKDDDTHFSAVAKVKLGPVKASFKGKVELLDLDPPNGYRIPGEGEGAWPALPRVARGSC